MHVICNWCNSLKLHYGIPFALLTIMDTRAQSVSLLPPQSAINSINSIRYSFASLVFL